MLYLYVNRVAEEIPTSSSFHIVDKKTNCLASPEFSTRDEAKQFAEIFGISEQSGHGLRENLYPKKSS